MSMYSHTQTREHMRRAETQFQSFVAVHNEHVLSIVVELVMQLLLIGALLALIMFLAAAYARAVVHFTSLMWMHVQDEHT
jgi:hypothetical protein